MVVPVGLGSVVVAGAGDDLLVFRPSDPLNFPCMQVSPKGTEKPHPPQLLLSVMRLTQVSLHRVIPSEHWPLIDLTTGPGPALVLFCAPAGPGEPERTKYAATPIIRKIPINPMTSTDRGIAVFGPGSVCKGRADGDGRSFIPAVPGCEDGACGVPGTIPARDIPQDLQKSCPFSNGLPHSGQNGIATPPH
jgi:hypothetical protein